MAEPIIEIKGLGKKYRIARCERYLALRDTLADFFRRPFGALGKVVSGEDFWALKDISFDVRQGEVVGIIGRNGAGKTTLLKILSRIAYPAEGEIRLRGRVGSLLEVGTGFHPELTGRENIYFNGVILGMKKKEIEDKFDEIVEFSGVEKFLDIPVKRFSSGMQVRLAFSVAAHLEPEILLVDEVLAVGDAQFQKKCLGKMKNVSEGGRTVIFVSHNMSAVRNLCNRTIVLEGGRLSMDADSETAIARYLQQNLATGATISSKEIEVKLEGVINRANPSVRIREVALLNEQGLPCVTFNSDEEIKIRITYECMTIVTDLRVNIYIVDEENRAIVATQNIDNQPLSDPYQKRPGVYTSVCYFPPNMFGEKHFFVSVHLEYPKVEHLILDRILGFDVVFQGYNNTVGIKYAFMRPLLNWETEYISDRIKEKQC